MAVGDMKADLQSIATTAFLDIQPSGTEEVVIHNIYAEADVEISRYDGTDEALIDSCPSTGRWWANLSIHVNNTQRIRIKNVNAASKDIGYDGIVTKA